MAVVLGTAGHIDHGKTSLVRALTGMDCDRLDEERRRGITIELGFAWMDLPDGKRLGLVDVPGHERFVKNMVAGATGIDCVLLVIAADEGVMPQTREHLEICSLLGVRSGLIALTKIDLVEPEWLAMVEEDVRLFLRGTFLENSPILPVSSATGQGVPELRDAIIHHAAELTPRGCSDLFRLPVDRVFSLKGYGTIVTGTVISGTCRAGDELTFMPPDLHVRARTLQNHGQPAETAQVGQRCAVNVQGSEVADILRGFVLAHPGTLFPSRRWIVHLTCLSSAPRPLRQRTEIHFHHGTRECSARVIFFERDKLLPGETALAELRFSAPLVGVFGDRCVLRAYAPLRTVAGGPLICPLPPELRAARRAHALPLIARLPALGARVSAPTASKNAVAERDKARAELVSTVLCLGGVIGADVPHLQVLTGLHGAAILAALNSLGSNGDAICWDRDGRWWTSKEALASLVEACLARAAEIHSREPLKPVFSRGALCSGWSDGLPPKLVQTVLNHTLKRQLLCAEGEGLRLPSHNVSLAEDQAMLRQRLLDAHVKGGVTPPNLRDVLESLQVDAKTAAPILRLLCETGDLVKVKEGLYYHAPALASILQQVRNWFSTHDNLDIGNLKELLGLSRKYLITLLEYMDNSHITVRVGDQRHLRQ